MLPKLATESAGPCTNSTTCRNADGRPTSNRVDARRTHRRCTLAPRRCGRVAAWLVGNEAVRGRSSSHAGRPESGRDASDDPRHHLRARLDEDHSPAHQLHERAETETNA